MNELIVIAYTEDETFQVGSTKGLNDLVSSNNSKAGVIDISPVDHSRDGKPEEIDVNIGLVGTDPADIKSVVVMQTVSYSISDFTNIDIKLPLINVF